MKKLIVFLLLISAFSCIAETKLDSLYNEWQNTKKSDSARVFSLTQFIRDGVLFTKPDSAFYLSEQLLAFSKEKKVETGRADAYNFFGISKTLVGEYKEALGYFEKSLKITESIKDMQRKSISLINIAIIYDNMGEYTKALEYNKRSIENYKKLGNKRGLILCYNNIGIIYDNMGDNVRALEYYNQCLSISKEVKDDRGIASSLINIGMILSDQKDYKKAQEYIEKSLKHSEIAKDNSNIANAYNNLGYIFGEQGKYKQAFEYYNDGLKKYIDINEKKGIASSLFSIGDLKLNQKLYNDALWYFNESLKLYEELELSLDLANNLNKNGKSYFALGQISKAIENCKRGFEISKKIGAIEVEKESCECLYDLYKEKGDTKNALLYHERMLVLVDSVKFEETSKKLLMMEFRKQLIADSLEQEKEKLETRLVYQESLTKENNIRNIAIGSGILLLIIIGGLYIRIRYIRGSRAEAEYERNRSENLLLNILPAEIAEELKEKGKSEARDFEMVSILFTDFKEFTQTSEQLSAKELVEEINVCFEFFDSVCEKHNIEKIKTIGDSYMAAGGLPKPTPTSTKDTVLAAIEMSEFIKERENILLSDGKLPFQMRVGIHTGPVVAGIVGIKKFQYDIWGDTVNTASRMESAGEVGRVNVSQYTYQLLKDDPELKFAPRGKIEAKGKGEIDMYFAERV